MSSSLSVMVMESYGWMSQQLLCWYDEHRRSFPWRNSANPMWSTPYAIWISEMMLQQTGTSVVVPYYHRFMTGFPTLEHLAKADEEDVLHLWQGLGYYRRARYIHQAARQMMHDGIPKNYEEWRALPGVGPYTAAALTTIVLNHPAVAIDGNIRRVLRRFLGLQGPCSDTALHQHGQKLLPSERWGDYTQALMDLGSTVCTVKAAQCQVCPLRDQCVAYGSGCVEACLPPTSVTRTQPLVAHILVIQRREDQHVWMYPEHTASLWQGLWRFAGTSWHTSSESLPTPPKSKRWTYHGTIKHALTHYRCTAHVWSMNIDQDLSQWHNKLVSRMPQGRWVRFPCQAPAHSRLMSKIWAMIQSSNETMG